MEGEKGPATVLKKLSWRSPKYSRSSTSIWTIVVDLVDTQIVTGAVTPNTAAKELNFRLEFKAPALDPVHLLTLKFPSGASLTSDDLVADERSVGRKLEGEKDQKGGRNRA
jgi:hypothetical protein